MNTSIRTEYTYATLDALHQEVAARAKSLPFMKTGFYTLLAAAIGVMAFEAHVVHATFASIFGNDSEVWQPWIMSMTSVILVLAIHFMAQSNPSHPTIQMINSLSTKLVPVYLFGIGVLVVVSLYFGGLNELLNAVNSSDAFSPDGTDSEPESNWLQYVMSEYVSPAAGVLFSLGIGSLAVMSVFVAHSAMAKAETLYHKITTISADMALDLRNMEGFRKAGEDRDERQAELDSLIVSDDNHIRIQLADEVLLQIQETLIPTLTVIQKEKYTQLPEGVVMPNQLDIAALEKAIKPLQAITRDNLIKHMQ